MNAGKSKVMVSERKEIEVNWGNPYRVSAPVDERHEIVIGKRMEGVKKY